MSASMLLLLARRRPPLKWRGIRASAALLTIALLLCASLLVALELPSKPFLEKNSFYLTSAGFRARLANDPAGMKAMHALPPHRFVIHTLNGQTRYLFAEPNHCVCIFVGTQDNYQNYRDILKQPLPQADFVSPDYKTQSSGAVVWRSLRLEFGQRSGHR